MLSMPLYEPLYPVDLISPEPASMLQSDGIEPESGCIILALDMNVRWLLAIACIEEESVGADSQRSWR
jgi:hypothetical protein